MSAIDWLEDTKKIHGLDNNFISVEEPKSKIDRTD